MTPTREQFKDFIAAIQHAQHVPFYISPLWAAVYMAFNIMFDREDIEGLGNELSWWFEMAPKNDATYYIDDVEHNISDIDAFYNYLVEPANN